jgi:hypothetical protein
MTINLEEELASVDGDASKDSAKTSFVGDALRECAQPSYPRQNCEGEDWQFGPSV